MINTIAPVNSAKIGRIAAPSPSGAVKVAAKRTVVRAPEAIESAMERGIEIRATVRAAFQFSWTRVFTVVTDGRVNINYFYKVINIRRKGWLRSCNPPF